MSHRHLFCHYLTPEDHGARSQRLHFLVTLTKRSACHVVRTEGSDWFVGVGLRGRRIGLGC